MEPKVIIPTPPVSTSKTIQGSKIAGWKKGARIGLAFGLFAGLVGIIFLLIKGDSSEFGPELLFQMALPIVNLGLVFLCIGSFIGRYFGEEKIPYKIKIASITTVLPVAFLVITGFDPNIGMGFMLVLVYLMFAPVPLFAFGFIIGLIIDRIIINKHKKNHPELYINQNIYVNQTQAVSSGSNPIKKFFDYFLRP